MNENPRGPDLRVLVIDDNESNRAYAAFAMEDEGFAVSTASNSREGIDSFMKLRPDCVLLDVRMPETDGFETCRSLRSSPHGSSAAIIFLTAARTADMFELAMAVGADDFIAKPVLANELVARVRAAVRTRALRAGMIKLQTFFNQHRAELARLEVLSPFEALERLSAQMEEVLTLTNAARSA